MSQKTGNDNQIQFSVPRPATYAFACGGVMQDPSNGSLPIAYFDSERALIYVAPLYRSDVQHILNAHISKSGTWAFIVEGKEKNAKEDGETLPYHDPKTDPKVGDTRVFKNRRCVDVEYQYNCIRLIGGNGPAEWIKRKPLVIGQCMINEASNCKETFGVLGRANIYSDAACTKLIRKTDLLGWQCLEG